MKSDDKALHYFLGANTPQGFVSRFDQLADAAQGWRTFVIKGGPGCGKSTLMKKVAAHLRAKGQPLELIHCSSDAESLDAVIAPGLKFSIADGTSPHVIEPKYPGAAETIVNMGECWDDEALYACREEIVGLTQSCSRCHEHCCRFLGAAGSLSADTYRMALDCVLTQKLAGYCARLSEKEFKTQRGGRGTEKVRFFSAVTPQGVVAFTGSAKELCQRIYLINDDYGAVSRLLLQAMRSNALAAGYDIITCYCPLSPFEKLEQLFIPALGIGFMTSNTFHNFELDVDAYRIVNCKRFSDPEKLRVAKKRMRFNRKATAQMVEQATGLLQEAKSLHDELEGYYINAVDFACVETVTNRVLERIDKMFGL